MEKSVAARSQFACFRCDVMRAVNGRWWRLFTLPFSPAMQAIALYPADRFLYLLCGRSWVAARKTLLPLGLFLRPWLSGIELHYRADMGLG